jgi:ribosomal protein S18 acetylase RimI-like enzyme
MTDAFRLRSGEERREYVIERVHAPEAIAELLNHDRLFAAYALAQLEPDGFPRSEWWACAAPDGTAVVCHSRAGLGNATVALGPSEGVAAILSVHPGSNQTFATADPDHLSALEEAYFLAEHRIMWRMHLTAETFEARGLRAVRLHGGQVRALNKLYASEGGPTSYRARHVDDGCYYGVIDAGRLVAVAGTHAISPTHSIAVIGNVFTHPQYRGRGLATETTSAVATALLPHCQDVVLSVDPRNAPAVRSYEALGFRTVGEIVEAAAWRQGSSISGTLRRLAARLRGRDRAAEIVWR